MKKAYVHTFGCQMNDHDSGRIREILVRENYEIEPDLKDAQLVIINTCSVREGPENKLYSLLGRLSLKKKKQSNLTIGVAGCVAQQEGEKILKREKAVDFVFGTDSIFKLPGILKSVNEGQRVVSTEWLPREKKIQNFIPESELEWGNIDGCKAFVAITKGCNNFCTFCIVPQTRGRLVSREPENILHEAKDLISKGAREIHLIGQNVNSYQTEGFGFLELLKAVANLNGLLRLRFTSPHPNDWNRQLTDLLAAHATICNHIHLPFQAGSDRILALMRRGHTAQAYLDQTEYLQEKIPDLSISTDVIVGYPSESEEDFQQTLKILKAVEFSQVYAFKYSPRPDTKAWQMEDDVPKKVKEDRLNRLWEIQDPIQSGKLDLMMGTIQEVLVDSAHPRERGAMNGRTGNNVPVTMPGCELEIGDLATFRFVGRRKHSLIGEIHSQK